MDVYCPVGGPLRRSASPSQPLKWQSVVVVVQSILRLNIRSTVVGVGIEEVEGIAKWRGKATQRTAPQRNAPHRIALHRTTTR
jgi:hypothetical protein